jgi:hypothetical protein
MLGWGVAMYQVLTINIAFEIFGLFFCLICICISVPSPSGTGKHAAALITQIFIYGIAWHNIALIECDYFDWLTGDSAAAAAYQGVYMEQYSWAEDTNAMLYWKQQSGDEA